MPEALSAPEISRQYAELLPARTVLSLFSATGPGANGTANSADGSTPTTLLSVPIFPNQTNVSSTG